MSSFSIEPPQTIYFVYQVEYIWVCNDFRKILHRSRLLTSLSQKKPKARLSTVLYILVCAPFLTGIDLNDVIFPFTAAISGNRFGAVCLFSLSCSIFIHSFSFRLCSTGELIRYDNGSRNGYPCSILHRQATVRSKRRISDTLTNYSLYQL